MRRELFGCEIGQKSKTEYLSATDLVRAGNKWRVLNGLPIMHLQSWLRNKKVKEFMREIEMKYEMPAKTVERGNKQTWAHPLLFVDLALAISPRLKIEVYEWLMDSLLKYRNDSGDSYKMMVGALYVRATRGVEFSNYIRSVANMIRVECGVKDWQRATELQLRKRDKFHENIKLLADVLSNNDEAVRLGILKTKEYYQDMEEISRNRKKSSMSLLPGIS